MQLDGTRVTEGKVRSVCGGGGGGGGAGRGWRGRWGEEEGRQEKGKKGDEIARQLRCCVWIIADGAYDASTVRGAVNHPAQYPAQYPALYVTIFRYRDNAASSS